MERDSATLGYAHEQSIPMEADHQGIARFPEKENHRYIHFQSFLTQFVPDVDKHRPAKRGSCSMTVSLLVLKLLDIKGTPFEDQVFYSNFRPASSCQWILRDTRFSEWLEDQSYRARLLWVHGPPISGKSVLASFLVEYLQETLQVKCQFFYFRFDQQDKTSLSAMLRSIAYQAACQISEFGHDLRVPAQDGIVFQSSAPDFLWEKLFVELLFRQNFNSPIYWIIDGLDASDSPSMLPMLLASTRIANIPLRIAIFSRPPISTHIGRLKSFIGVDEISIHDGTEDLVLHIRESVQQLQGASEEATAKLTDIIVKHSKGNFLWARQILKDVETNAGVTEPLEALGDLSIDWSALYRQIVDNLSIDWRTGDEAMATTIVAWATCSLRPMTLWEFDEILRPAGDGDLALKRTITRICGDLIVIDHGLRVTLLDETTREYLTREPGHKLYIDCATAHSIIFAKCMTVLNSLRRWTPPEKEMTHSLVLYAVTSWHRHLNELRNSAGDCAFGPLANFLCGPSSIVWIHFAALHGQLETIVDASQALSSYFSSLQSRRYTMIITLDDQRKLTELTQWARDLEKIVSHFGETLRHFPDAIYDLIPPFCPSDTSVHKYGAKRVGPRLTVKGFADRQWDELEACFPVTDKGSVRRVRCGGRFFVTASTAMDGHIVIFDNLTNQKLHELYYGEPIKEIQLSNSGDKIAIYGYRTTKIWDISDEPRFIACASNSEGSRILDLSFTVNDKSLYAFEDDGIVKRISLEQIDSDWEDVCHLRSPSPNNRYVVPNCASFNPDSSALAISYPGLSLSIWEISPTRHVCDYPYGSGDDQSTAESVTWNPVSKHVIARDGYNRILKWHPYREEAATFDGCGIDIECSPDGTCIAITHSGGILKVHRFDDFSLLHIFSGHMAIRHIAFSRCGQKIYDVRESHCNVWQLSSQFNWRCGRKDEETKLAELRVLQASTDEYPASSERTMPITTLAVCQRTGAYCAGSMSGTLTVFLEDGDLVKCVRALNLPITHVAWGENAPYLATADVTASVYIRWIDLEQKTLQNIFEFQVDHKISQLLFNNKASLLLVAGPGSLTLFSVDRKTIVATQEIEGLGYRWVNHSKEEYLIGWSPVQVQITQWNGLADWKRVPMSWTRFKTCPDNAASQVAQSEGLPYLQLAQALVENVWLARDKSIFVVQVSHPKALGKRKSEFILVRARDVEPDRMHNRRAIPASDAIPPGTCARIEYPLGLLHKKDIEGFVKESTLIPNKFEDQIAFLDRDRWICTVPLGATSLVESIKRHFLLPRSWMDKDCLAISQVTPKGAFLCPKGGELGLVQNGFKIGWHKFRENPE